MRSAAAAAAMEHGSAVVKISCPCFVKHKPQLSRFSYTLENSGCWEQKLHVGFHSADKEELLTFPVQTTLAFVHVLERKPRVLHLLIYQ